MSVANPLVINGSLSHGEEGIMKLLIAPLLILLSPCIAIAASTGTAQQAYDIYYLAVGNSHYATGTAAQGFNNLEGANKSARKVAAYLDQAGAEAGITLVSDRDKLVTKKDVLNALDNLLVKVKRSKSRNPLVVFYFCGHGVSEGIGWNHFSIPGDFIVPLEKINIDTLAKAAIYANEVSDAIENHKLPCLLLLDSCYEFEKVNLPDRVISQQLANNLTDAFKAVRYLNEFRDGPAMAVFSTRPGTVVPMAQDPIDTDSKLSIGPLARRLIMSFEQAFEKKGVLRIAEFLQQMSGAAFDQATPSVSTSSKPVHPDMQLIKYPLSQNSPGELRSGTGVPPKIDFRTDNDSHMSTPPAQPLRLIISPETYLLIQSGPNEYIGGGRTLKFSAQNVSYEVEQNEPDHIAFSIKDGDLSWSITFMSPAGKALRVGTYKNAQRAGFQEESRPGFELSGDGRGCNEIDAEFTILTFRRDLQRKLVEFSADFSQRCDRAAAVLKGQLRFRATSPITK